MTGERLRALVTEAVELDRIIQEQSGRLKELKARLVEEAESRPEQYTTTDGGGASWTADGDCGCIARVSFPAPTLKGTIKGEGSAIEKIRLAAGPQFAALFNQVPAYAPVSNFREIAVRYLPKGSASKLIRLCQTETAPRVSFETKDEAR